MKKDNFGYKLGALKRKLGDKVNEPGAMIGASRPSPKTSEKDMEDMSHREEVAVIGMV